MDRRGFLGALAGAAIAGYELDAERLLWTKTKTVFVPAPPRPPTYKVGDTVEFLRDAVPFGVPPLEVGIVSIVKPEYIEAWVRDWDGHASALVRFLATNPLVRKAPHNYELALAI